MYTIQTKTQRKLSHTPITPRPCAQSLVLEQHEFQVFVPIRIQERTSSSSCKPYPDISTHLISSHLTTFRTSVEGKANIPYFQGGKDSQRLGKGEGGKSVSQSVSAEYLKVE